MKTYVYELYIIDNEHDMEYDYITEPITDDHAAQFFRENIEAGNVITIKAIREEAQQYDKNIK